MSRVLIPLGPVPTWARSHLGLFPLKARFALQALCDVVVPHRHRLVVPVRGPTHICAGTGLTPPRPAPGLGCSPPPTLLRCLLHLRRGPPRSFVVRSRVPRATAKAVCATAGATAAVLRRRQVFLGSGASGSEIIKISKIVKIMRSASMSIDR